MAREFIGTADVMTFTLRFYNQHGELEGEITAFLLQTFFEFVTDYLDFDGMVQIKRAKDGAFEIREIPPLEVEGLREFLAQNFK